MQHLQGGQSRGHDEAQSRSTHTADQQLQLNARMRSRRMQGNLMRWDDREGAKKREGHIAPTQLAAQPRLNVQCMLTGCRATCSWWDNKGGIKRRQLTQLATAQGFNTRYAQSPNARQPLCNGTTEKTCRKQRYLAPVQLAAPHGPHMQIHQMQGNLFMAKQR